MERPSVWGGLSADLQLEADEHSQEDEAKAEDADGQADEAAEGPSLPGWVVRLFTACHWTAPLHTLRDTQTSTVSTLPKGLCTPWQAEILKLKYLSEYVHLRMCWNS